MEVAVVCLGINAFGPIKYKALAAAKGEGVIVKTGVFGTKFLVSSRRLLSDVKTILNHLLECPITDNTLVGVLPEVSLRLPGAASLRPLLMFKLKSEEAKRKIFARSIVELILGNKSHSKNRISELLRRSSIIYDLQCSQVSTYWFGACEFANLISLPDGGTVTTMHAAARYRRYLPKRGRESNPFGRATSRALRAARRAAPAVHMPISQTLGEEISRAPIRERRGGSSAIGPYHVRPRGEGTYAQRPSPIPSTRRLAVMAVDSRRLAKL